MRQRIYQIVALIFCLLVTGAQPVMAETNPPLKISSMKASIMPEYDTSDVLVLYARTFVNTSEKPYTGEMRFPVPKGSTNNIVKETATNNDSHISVKVEDKGSYSQFVWQPAQPIQPGAGYPIHLEYYYNPIPGAGLKAFEYRFPANIPVDKADFSISQPLKSTDLKIEPASPLLGQDKQGFQVYGFTRSIKSGEEVVLKISYNKTIPNPSIQKPGTVGASQTNTASGSQLGNLGVLLPLAAIIILIGVIGYKAFNKRRDDEEEEEEEEEEPVRVPTKTNKSKTTAKAKPRKSGGQEQPMGKTNKRLAQEKRKLRDLLLNGVISEETYHQLIYELEEEYS